MGERTWPHLLGALLRREPLSAADAGWAMGEIMAGAATPAQIAAFVVALRAKGETAAEIAGLVEVMLATAVPVRLPPSASMATAETWLSSLNVTAVNTATRLVPLKFLNLVSL